MSQNNYYNLHPPSDYIPHTPSEIAIPVAPPPTACSNQVLPSPITPKSPVRPPLQPVQTFVVTGDRFGPSPCRAMCHHCRAEVITYTVPVIGGLTWLVSGLICITGLVCGCCLIPFFANSCKDVEHRCPKCNMPMGMFKRMC